MLALPSVGYCFVTGLTIFLSNAVCHQLFNKRRYIYIYLFYIGWLAVCLSLCLSVCHPICLSARLPACRLSVCVFLSVLRFSRFRLRASVAIIIIRSIFSQRLQLLHHLSIHFSVCLYVCLHQSFFCRPSVYLYVSVYQLVNQSVSRFHRSVRLCSLSVYLYVSLFVSPFLYILTSARVRAKALTRSLIHRISVILGRLFLRLLPNSRSLPCA